MLKKMSWLPMLLFVLLIWDFNAPQAIAGTFVASIEWMLSDSNGQQVAQPSFMLDIDFGDSYYNAYGAVCSLDGETCTPTIGSGYLFANNVAQTDISVHMDIRGGTKLYRLVIDLDSLDGTCAVYNKDGNFEEAMNLILHRVWNTGY